eukprot:scaffold55763_cov75-Phaeocystis_antarctica.AAC.2
MVVRRRSCVVRRSEALGLVSSLARGYITGSSAMWSYLQSQLLTTRLLGASARQALPRRRAVSCFNKVPNLRRVGEGSSHTTRSRVARNLTPGQPSMHLELAARVWRGEQPHDPAIFMFNEDFIYGARRWSELVATRAREALYLTVRASAQARPYRPPTASRTLPRVRGVGCSRGRAPSPPRLARG